MDFTSTLPSCAPTRSDPGMNRVGWDECVASGLAVPEKLDENGFVVPGTGSFDRTYSLNCKPCVPDPNTPCGQMLIAGGFTENGMVRVPPSCATDCCSSSSTGNGGNGSDNGNVSSTPKFSSGLRNWVVKNKNMLLVLIFVLALGLLLYLLMKTKK
jgi:hypothetical protein